jgi:hypothetical protein
LCLMVDDKHPGMTMDVEVAVKAIVEQAEKGNGDDRVYVTGAICEAVINALRAAYPRRFIVMRTIVELLQKGGGPGAAGDRAGSRPR